MVRIDHLDCEVRLAIAVHVTLDDDPVRAPAGAELAGLTRERGVGADEGESIVTRAIGRIGVDLRQLEHVEALLEIGDHVARRSRDPAVGRAGEQESIRAGSSGQDVLARSAEQPIVLGAAMQLIVAFVTTENVGAI